MQLLPMRRALERADFTVFEAQSGEEALSLHAEVAPDIILLDLMMSGMDGYATCRELREQPGGEYLPVLITTSLEDQGSIEQAYACGATDFITKPINWSLLPHRVHYMLRSSYTTLALARSEMELIESRMEIIRRLGVAAEFKDHTTGSHLERISHYAMLVGQAVGLDEGACRMLKESAPMHDVGKIATPDHILLKPGKLTQEEFAIIKEHPVVGAEMLANHQAEQIKSAQTIALTHHERWDGSGYPYGIAGVEIPLFGRICALVDVFDALTTKRPYKEAWRAEAALKEIKRGAGSHFDPQLVAVFEAAFPQVLKIMSHYSDQGEASDRIESSHRKGDHYA
uniref:Putative Response regulator receiver modulated metal dependent phosphohydrolase n=1 Tax=Magnetococcus massalia (strain MO-1) TaxID=451514 RepID=A0A1S7LF85_MAGMO|nr:putative Response regulator receiver modulated metal dependent phosphohydrolase [Candidatus Magnetococcus massalia]